MERLEQAVLCLKSVAYSNLTLSANRTRSLPASTQGHTGILTYLLVCLLNHLLYLLTLGSILGKLPRLPKF